MQNLRAFVIKNQFEQYLDKQSGWLSGKDTQALYRTPHHDEALNTLIELNAKDISLRGEIIEVDLDQKKRPVVEVSDAALQLEKDLAGMEKQQASRVDEAPIEKTTGGE